MKIFLSCILFLFLILMGCSSSQKASDAKENALFNKWLQHPKSQLINTWGLPDSTMPDNKGGEILIYKERTDYKSVMNEKYTGTQFSFRKEMYVNADSVIYFWKSKRRK